MHCLRVIDEICAQSPQYHPRWIENMSPNALLSSQVPISRKKGVMDFSQLLRLANEFKLGRKESQSPRSELSPAEHVNNLV